MCPLLHISTAHIFRIASIILLGLACLGSLASLGVQPAFGMQAPLKGVVWSVPEDRGRAAQDLIDMEEAGVEAIRTEPIRDPGLLELADTLGLRLFMDLPISRLPASRLVDTLRFAQAWLDTALALAREHPSIAAIGLAGYGDTSDSTACAYFRTLAERARAHGPPGTSVYYVTRFLENDACSTTVDFVLVDLRDAPNPAAELRRWAAGGERTPVGIGALGVPVRSDGLRGLSVTFSPERQARYLERHLPLLLADGPAVEMPAVFVHRWRDARRDRGIAEDAFHRIYFHQYGLQSIDGTVRPALRVMKGIYTGRQTVFAFERGASPDEPTPWSTLLGWIVLASLGIFYALSPRFRHMIPRYFQAHFFFREAVREGRDVLFGASSILLWAIGATSGLVTYVILEAARPTDAFALVVRWLHPAAQSALATLLDRPPVLLLLVGCVYVVALLVWALVLSLLSRRMFPVAPAQALMLVVWPRWPLLVVLVVAMVAASLPRPDPYLAALLAAAWVLTEIAAGVRTLVDLAAITRLSFWWLLPGALLNPAVVALTVAAVTMLGFQPEVAYVWHAAFRR